MSSASLRARLVGGGERGSVLPSAPLSSQLDLAREHMASGEYTAVRGLLEQMGDGASAAYRSLLFAAGAARPALPAVDGESASAGNAAGREAEGRPAHVTRLWVGGLVELAEGRFARSSGILSEAHALEPANPNLGLHLGVAQIGERRYGAAAQTLEGVARDHPAHIATRIALGAIYINHERLALAKDHLDAVIAVDPMHALAAYFLGRTELRLRNPMEAASAFRTAVIAAPEDLNAWFHLARAYRAGEYYGAAVDTYEELIRRQPTLFDAHLDLAFLYKHLSDRVSIAHKRKSERARPVEISSQAWHRYLAQLDQRALEYGELALSTFDRAQQIRPVGASGELQIGEILRRSGRFEEARQRFEWLARSEPTEWVHRYRLGTIAIRQEDDARAIAHLEGALQLAPTEGDVYVALGLAHLKMGRTHDAIATLERGAIYEPFNPALFTNLGAAYLESDDLPRARKSLERALTLRTFPLPRTHLAYTNLGIVHWREGEKEAALQALESAVHVFPDYAYARRLLADARSINAEARSAATPVYDDLLERFGETSTVHFPNE
jgi:tetratricopeptide (TPR) repeat protein